MTIGPAIIQEVADTLDMLPRAERRMSGSEVRELPAPIFSDASRAELWAAGSGNGDGELN